MLLNSDQRRRLRATLKSIPELLGSYLGLRFFGRKRGIFVYEVPKNNFSIGDFVNNFMNAKLIAQEKQWEIAAWDVVFYSPLDSAEYETTYSRAVGAKISVSTYCTYLNELHLLSDLVGASSTHVFREHEEFIKFVNANHARSRIFPPWGFARRWRRLRGEKFWDTWNLDVTLDFANKLGIKPTLEVPGMFREWVGDFRTRILKGQKLYTACFRVGSPNDQSRNVSLEWATEALAVHIPKNSAYVLIGASSENFPPDLLKTEPWSRALFSKDLGLTVFQEFLLINQADFYLGTNTGPSIAAVFSSHPYRIYYLDHSPEDAGLRRVFQERPSDFFGNPLQEIHYLDELQPEGSLRVSKPLRA